MATLNNIANALKSTTSSSGGGSSVSSALDKLVKEVSKTPNPSSGIIKPIPTDPGIIKPIPTTPIDPGIIKPIPTTPIDPGIIKPLPTDPGIIKPIPTTPIDPGFKPLPTSPGITKPLPVKPGEIIHFEKNNGAIKEAVEQAQVEQIKNSASEFMKNNSNSLTNDEIKNKLMDNESFNKLSDAEVKEKMKDLYFKEGLNEEQVKNKLKETENLSSSELKEQFKAQYSNAAVNGLINSSTASFITGGAAGLASGGDRMSITISEIPNIVSKLRSCESRVREIWSDLLNTYINQIENSWAGADAQAYIEKVRGYNSKIENSAQALSLLADTYEKVIATSQDTQQKVMNAVNNY